MPTPVAFLLNRPVRTFSLDLKPARGSRLLLRAMSGPVPLAHQWFGLTPLPMKSVANRLGNAGTLLVAASLPHTGMDSSQGRAMATPTPRRTVRRSMRESVGFMDGSSLSFPWIISATFVQELRTGDNGPNQAFKAVIIRNEPGLHRCDGRLI